ncbi:unnamed protein product, partial [Allacma fusca]
MATSRTRAASKSFQNSSAGDDSGYNNSIASSNQISTNPSSGNNSGSDPNDAISTPVDLVRFETPETLPESIKTYSLNTVINSTWDLLNSLNPTDPIFQMLERCIIPFAEGGMDEKYLSERRVF